MLLWSSAGGRDVKAGGLAFEFHHTLVLHTEVSEDFCENILQLFIGEGNRRYAGFVETGVGYVECGSELVGRRVGCVSVDPTEFLDGMGGTEHGGYSDLISGGIPFFERVGEISADSLDQSCRLGHKVRHGVSQGFEGVPLT